MYAYRIVASDNFDPWNDREKRDLSYDELIAGYLLINSPTDNPSYPDHFRTYFAGFSDKAEYAYNVRDTNHLLAFRSIVVEKADGEIAVFELATLPTIEINNDQGSPEQAYKLTDIITGYITTTPENYSYFFVCSDDYLSPTTSNTFTWEHIQDGYYLSVRERTFFPNFNADGGWRLQRVVRINVITPSVIP
jgi:hypothetical protein